MAGETELGEGIERAGGDIQGRFSAVEVGEQAEQALHQRRIGGHVEMDGAVSAFPRYPGGGYATRNACGLHPGLRGQSRAVARAFDDRREAFLRIIDQGPIVEELLLAGG